MVADLVKATKELIAAVDAGDDSRIVAAARQFSRLHKMCWPSKQ